MAVLCKKQPTHILTLWCRPYCVRAAQKTAVHILACEIFCVVFGRGPFLNWKGPLMVPYFWKRVPSQNIDLGLVGLWKNIELRLLGLWQNIKLGFAGLWQNIELGLVGLWQNIKLGLVGLWQNIELGLFGLWQNIELGLVGLWQNIE